MSEGFRTDAAEPSAASSASSEQSAVIARMSRERLGPGRLTDRQLPEEVYIMAKSSSSRPSKAALSKAGKKLASDSTSKAGSTSGKG